MLYGSCFVLWELSCDDGEQDTGNYRDKGSNNAGNKGCGRIDRTVLAAISNDINRNQLQGSNIDNQKGAHIGTCPGFVFFRIEFGQLFHGF